MHTGRREAVRVGPAAPGYALPVQEVDQVRLGY